MISQNRGPGFEGTLMAGGYPDVTLSIVIVSWNVAGLLEQCIESIIKHSTGIPLEIIVVDNASDDRTREMLREQFPAVKVIANEKNEGFARANNQALKRIAGRFVLILNPDTILVDRSLDRMIQFMDSHPEVGMAGPCVAYPNGEIQKTCARLIPNLAGVLFHDIFHLWKLPFVGKRFAQRVYYPYDYSITQEVDAISGAAMMVRREIVETVGGFGESFIHYGEDLDWCFRIKRAGWQIHYVSDASVVHFSSQSSRQVPVRTAVNGVLSMQEYFSRCFGPAHGGLYRFLACAIEVPLMVMMGCTKVLLRRESGREFRQRLVVAKAVWLWRELK
jgi:GT2 family glycosyltransferase